MSEAIISRRGYDANGKPELRTEIITGTTNWTVPNSIRNSTISVRIFGGGGYNTYGGGSGWMNNGEITVTPGQKIPITIGSGGNSGNNVGGTTSFGTYLSAIGGNKSNGGAGGPEGTGYQFGGGGAGGNGGMWGGGGGGGAFNSNFSYNGGTGGTYGGGGGGGGILRGWSNMTARKGGNGGTYGGGGGGCYLKTVISSNYSEYSYGGIGGTYGGNGGDNKNEPEYGTNTLNNEQIPSNLRGNGSTYRGIGMNINGTFNICLSGGGGYGGYGGHGSIGTVSIIGYNNIALSGGGGGGYGGKGGSGTYLIYNGVIEIVGGGGGGFGGNGESGKWDTGSFGTNSAYGGGGGGYFSNGESGGGGGYYNYCHGGSLNFNSNSKGYSYGTGSDNSRIAKGGACIIEYWI